MVTSIETLSKLGRRVVLIFALDDIQIEINKRLKVRARTAQARGFRPGKIPMKMLTAQFGPQIKIEVLNDKLITAFKDIITKNNLCVVGYPKIEKKISQDSLIFHVIFEIYPKIIIGDLSLVKIEKITSQITDLEINKTINLLHKQRLHYYVKGKQDTCDNSTDQLAQIGNRVTIDFVGKINKATFPGSTVNDFVFILGENHVPPEFEDAIVNLKIGTFKNFLLTFSHDYDNQDIAGKTAEFYVFLKKIECADQLEIDTKFAKSLGISDGNLDKMRSNIKYHLELEMNARIKARTKNDIMNALINISSLEDVPKILVEQEAKRLTEIARQDIVQRGIDVKNIDLSNDSFIVQAERRVRLSLILTEIAKIYKLTPTKEQIRARIKEFTENYENPKQVLEYYFSDSSQFSEIAALVLEENVVNYVLTQCKISEKVLMFDTLMNHESQKKLLF